MSKSLVKREVDLANLPLLTDEQKAEVAMLAAQSEPEIDTSDLPVMPEGFWENATPGRFYKPTKTATTVRIDSDILVWLRSQGKNYQTRLNAILRRAMLEAMKSR